jgi:hypothetical protein
MRGWSVLLLVLGLFLLAHSTYDECRGITHKPLSLARRRFNSGYLYRIPVRREQNPELFRQFMTGHWLYAGLFTGIGVALFITRMPRKD